MANEFKHLSVGGEITQAEYEAVGGHVLASQAIGDIIYASSTSQLSRLGIGDTGAVLVVDSGIPSWDTTWSPAGDITLADTVDLLFGTGADAGFRWSTGDASNHSLVLGLDNTGQQLHITDQGAIATDWARSAGTHPEVSIHSNTTPATDYLAIGNHDGTTASIDVVGGTTLDLRIAGTDELQITAAGINTNGGTITGTTISATLLTASISLALATGATVTGIDNGSLGTSATLLATQGAIKTYVDAQQDTVDTLAEILALSNTTGGTDIIMTDGDDLNFGSGGDIMLRHSGAVSADAEVTTIIAGTSVHPGVAADSLIVSNITASGDMMFATNRGGNTEAHMLFDASAGDTFLYARGVEALKIAGGGAMTITPALTVTGAITASSDIDVDGTTNLDNTDIDGTLVVDGTNISLDSTTTLNIDNSNTSNGVTIATATSGVPISIGHATSETTVNDNLTVTGDLTINGTTTTVDTATLAVEDPLIALATGNNAADALDIGIYGLYDTSGSQDEYSGLFRDATDEKWKLFQDLQVAPTTTVNTGGAGYAVGTLVATLEGNVTGNVTGNVSGTAPAGSLTGTTLNSSVVTSSLTTVGTIASGTWQSVDVGVEYGGTGVSALTDHGVVLGSGTGAVSVTDAGTSGEVLISGGSGADPDWGAAGSYTDAEAILAVQGEATLALEGAVSLDATKKLLFDGQSGHTYIYQESDDDLHIVVGNTTMIALDQDKNSYAFLGASNLNNRLFHLGGGIAGSDQDQASIFTMTGTLTSTSGHTNYVAQANFNGAITTQDASETIANVANVRIAGLNPTIGTDTVTNASTLLVTSAPTTGTNKYAIYMPSGALGVSDGSGSSGEQLTSGGAGSNVTWASASSERSSKTAIMERSNDAEVLATLIGTPVHDFKYINDPSRPNTGDYDTDYVGIIADEAPWAMHHNGRILNPINTFGYTVQGFKALEARISDLESQLEKAS
jgi:hypothetical protein